MQTDTTQLRELTIRYSVKKDVDGHAVKVGRTLNAPRDAASVLMTLLQDEPSEVFVLLCLTTKHRAIAFREVSRGDLDSVQVHPREVFKAALLANAAAVVVGHNHPSGDPTPSVADFEVTRRLSATGEILGIPLLDYVIIGDRRFIEVSRRRVASKLACQLLGP